MARFQQGTKNYVMGGAPPWTVRQENEMNLEPNLILENLEGINDNYRALFADPANAPREHMAPTRHHSSATLPVAKDPRVAGQTESARIERVTDRELRGKAYLTRGATLGVGAMVVLLRQRNG